MSDHLRLQCLSCSGLIALVLLSGCLSDGELADMTESTTRTGRAGPVALIPEPEIPPDPETYQALGFDDREAWAEAVLSLTPRAPDGRRAQAPADRYSLPRLRTLQPNSQQQGIYGGTMAMATGRGADVNLDAVAAASLGYAQARRILAAHPWLRDARTAHVHPAVLADALDGMETHNVLWGSLEQTGTTPPAVWPQINIGGRYTAEEVARLKQNAVQVVSRSDLPHWAIILTQLFHASPDAVNLYVASTPTHADIVHRKTGKHYGITGNDLTVSHATLTQLEVRMPGYTPCRVRPKPQRTDTIYRCDLEPLARDTASQEPR